MSYTTIEDRSVAVQHTNTGHYSRRAWWTYNGGGSNFNESFTPVAYANYGGRLTRKGQDNVGWREKISDGSIVSSPYERIVTAEVVRIVPATGTLERYTAGTSSTATVEEKATFSIVPARYSCSILHTQYIAALNDARTLASTAAQADAADGAAMTAVTILEARETVNLITTSVLRLAKLVQLARRDLRRSPKEFIKYLKKSNGNVDTALSLWLEYRYGWTPLVYDVQDHIKAYDNIIRGEAFKLQRYRANSSEGSFTISHERDVSLGSYYVGVGQWRAQVALRGDIRKRILTYGAIANFYVKLSSDSVTAYLYELGGLNPARTAIEVIPLSFVWDWFANISDYFAATTACTALYDQAGGSVATKLYGIEEIDTSVVTSTQLKDTALVAGRLMYATERFERKVLTPGAFVGVAADVYIDTSRAIDAIALGRGFHKQLFSDAKRIRI